MIYIKYARTVGMWRFLLCTVFIVYDQIIHKNLREKMQLYGFAPTIIFDNHMIKTIRYSQINSTNALTVHHKKIGNNKMLQLHMIYFNSL